MSFPSHASIVRFIGSTVLIVASLAAQGGFEAYRNNMPFDIFSAPGDLDADGDIDLLSFDGNVYAIRWNDGDANFTSGPSFTLVTGGPPASRFIFDADLDGLDDIVTVRNAGAMCEFSVHRNLGGTFASPVIVAFPGSFHSVRFFRGDDDAHPDLLVGLSVFPEVAFGWLRGTPSGHLAAFVPMVHPPPVLSFSSGLSSGDIDGDGDDDLVARAFPSDGVLRIYCNEAGELSPLPTIPVPSEIDEGRPYLADLDGDGDLDILLLRGTSPSVSAMSMAAFNDGTGAFTLDPVIMQATVSTSPRLLDMNADGFADLVGTVGGLSVALGRGDGTFGTTQYVAQTSGGGVFGTVGIDFDGDGGPDVVDAGAILLTTGEYDGLSKSWRTFGDTDVDWDGDGDIDVVDLSGPQPWKWAANDGRGKLTPAANLNIVGSFGTGVSITDAFPIDYDGDGDLDLIVSLSTTVPSPIPGLPVSVFLEHRAATNHRGLFFIAGPLATAASGEALPFDREIGDIDGDGHLDIIGSGAVWYGNGAGTFTRTPVGVGWTSRGVADIDGDGRLDIIAHRLLVGAAALLVYLNQPGGFFEVTALLLPPSSQLFVSYVRAADIDGDSDLDLLVMLVSHPFSSFSTIRIIENNGSMVSPTVGTLYSFSGLADSMVCGDVDEDGKLEVIVVHSTIDPITTCTVLELSSSGLVEAGVNFSIGEPVSLVDVDGDGDLDLAGNFYYENRLHRRFNGAGERWQYGTATATSNGHAPVLGVSGALRPGETIEIRATRIRGSTAGYLAIGLVPFEGTDLPVTGLTTNIDAIIAGLPVVVGGMNGAALTGSVFLPAVVPPSLAGTTLYMQAAFLDPLGPAGITMTQGLALEFGQ